ncbi:MAG: Histidine ABC transporter, permease protein HisQ (TC 3.A.1.3.1) [uncultured Paraburkholderia sp.]|nr:MAG: Histidine ABC transporter, permease protein HisQ (TC 3.A.1.3.1) [uncultured Paraburkholderia sp.]
MSRLHPGTFKRTWMETHVVLYGFGPVLLAGTIQTVELSVLSLAAVVLLGLAGAAAKLSLNRPLRALATGYTTLIRSVPDLVLMLLFYSIQIAVNNLTDALDLPQFDIDPFVAGVLTLGFIYGAYFTETFRGAFLAVPRGQLEAGSAYGMSGARVFARILFPQMMRFALPGIGNNWQVLVKATALVSIIGLADVVKAAQDAGKSTFNMFFFILIAALIYLALTTVSNLALIWLERRYSIGVRHAEL